MRRLRPRSLQARLLVGLVATTALVLVLVAATLYAQQRRSALARADDQAVAAITPVDRALAAAGRPGAPPAGPFGRGQPFMDRRPPAQRLDPGALPLGVFGQRRDAGNTPIGGLVLLGYGDQRPSPPRLPALITPGTLITVPAQSGGGRYRVYAARSWQQTLTIAAVPLDSIDAGLRRLLLAELLLVSSGLLLLTLLSAWVIRVALRPLQQIAGTADAIAGGELHHRIEVEDPATEVGRLGTAFNGMLARIEGAFERRRAGEERLRAFIADASHELRTPLAAIRGYAELHRIGAASRPQEVEHAMRQIETEAARMGVLVEDLLMLARLDEQRTPVRHSVPLASLAADAAAAARAASGAGRTITVSVQPGLAAAAVDGDEHELRRVLDNLLANAVAHTPPGTPVEIALQGAFEGRELLLTVRDHGAGLPTADPDLLFERFWRPDGGRERGSAGAGLGLAIVAAIVAAHGGTVSAENAAGGGARFIVRLPRTDTVAQR